MAKRKIVEIDAEKCNGCGLCIASCAEGAIGLIDGKARLVKDDYCDGLGACLGECPQGAIAVIEREAAAFDEQAVARHQANQGRRATPEHPTRHTHQAGGGCPGSMMRQFAAPAVEATPGVAAPSALRQWPVQLRLVSPTAPYFRDADLLLAADCAAFACGDFHRRFITDHTLVIACPKLDDADGYAEKLALMITDGGIRSITIVMMQVPCCRGLERLVEAALQIAGVPLPVHHAVIGIEGEILVDETAMSPV